MVTDKEVLDKIVVILMAGLAFKVVLFDLFKELARFLYLLFTGTKSYGTIILERFQQDSEGGHRRFLRIQYSVNGQEFHFEVEKTFLNSFHAGQPVKVIYSKRSPKVVMLYDLNIILVKLILAATTSGIIFAIFQRVFCRD